MTMKANDMTEREPDLDDLFAAARDADSAPSANLMTRILTDAAALQPRPAVVATRLQPVDLPTTEGWFDRIAAVFGGGGALAGMSLATVAGVFLGLAQPAPIVALTLMLADASVETVDLLPDGTALWEE